MQHQELTRQEFKKNTIHQIRCASMMVTGILILKSGGGNTGMGKLYNFGLA